MGRFDRLASAIVTVMLAGAVLVSTVNASHSVPSPRWFWDYDNDGVAEVADASITFSQAGGAWTSVKADRASEAVAEWRTRTDWNPTYGAGSGRSMYVDGNDLCFSGWSSTTIAITCRVSQTKPTYVRLTDSDLSLNVVHYLWNWNNLEAPPQQGRVDAEGVISHELGHAVRLTDVFGSSCPPGPTMCGVIDFHVSFDLRVLTSDDISGANTVYLP